MPYTPRTWAEGEKGKAADLNRIEQAIAFASAAVNIRAEPYNAKGDGVTDDTAAIQAAVTAAKESVCLVPSGYYFMTAAIKVPPATAIIGENRWRCVLKTNKATIHHLTAESEGYIEISGLRFESTVKKTAGSAIDFATSASVVVHVTITDCTFGSRLFRGIDLGLKTGNGGAVYLERLIAAETEGGGGVKECCNGVAESPFFNIGDGEHLVTGVSASNIQCQANEPKDMPLWLRLKYVDTGNWGSTLFQTCENGIFFRNGPAGQEVSGLKFDSTIVDTANVVGWSIAGVRDLTMSGCNAQTCGTGVILLNANAAKLIGATVQNCVGEGVVFNSESTNCKLEGSVVADNNTSNTAGLAGIHVVAGAKGFQIINNISGNKVIFPLAGGKQKYGILLDASAGTDKYMIVGNRCGNAGTGAGENETKGIENKATGANKTEANNLVT